MALCEASSEPKGVSFGQLKFSVENEFRRLLKSYYGNAYSHTLAKGKLAGDEKISEVVHAVNMIEINLGIKIL